mmetsp:Transcript_53447/g.100558  ORF Transcript_53447/g.100558 Transcript_53447/m.100558 type:complete len:823 (-) Transcript_53447:158-2626(-)
MALPADFWRNEQMLNIFRTKPCQRLFRDGVCDWKSQCQYSHCLEWPRRPPQKHNYSPELCVHIRFNQNGEVNIESICPAGARCQHAHSKEEILYHPHIFKTKLCEEFRNTNGSQRNSRGNNRTRCHRYYCPFAHGQQELRHSPLSAEQRDQCLRAIEFFPSDDCCRVCLPHRMDSRFDGSPGANVLGFVPPGNQANPQEVPQSQSPPPTMWALPPPLSAQAALTDGETMMGVPKDRFPMPYNLQGSPPHLAALGTPQTPMVFRQWGAANDPAGFTAVAPASLSAEGCGQVVPLQLPQELQQSPQVHALGGNTAGGPPASTPPHTQMLVAMAPATSMQGCGMAAGVSPPGTLPMVQLTPIGQPGAPTGINLAASTPGGPMQMLQVTPVNPASQQGAAQMDGSPSRSDQAAAVAQWLHSIGLDRCINGLMRNGFDDKEVIANMTAEDMIQTGMNPAEQRILASSISDMLRQRNAENQAGLPRSNSFAMALPMANGNTARGPPGAPPGPAGMHAMQPVLLSNGTYGQWIQTGSPPMPQAANPGALPNGFGAWSPQAISIYAPVPHPPQATEQGSTPQPGYPTGHPQQAGQQMPTQQEVPTAMFLPPVPPFPIQAQQTMQHQAQQPNPQQSPPQQPSQQQLQLQMGAPGQAHAQSHSQLQGLALQALPSPQQQQLLAPMSASAPTNSATMSSPGHLGNGHASPGLSDRPYADRWAALDDPPASNSITEDSNNGKSQRRRNQKLERDKGLMRQVEKLLEAEDPPIMTLQDLRKRLMEYQGGNIDNPASLVRNLKVYPDRFLINNEYVTLTKFAHLDPVKSKFERQRK